MAWREEEIFFQKEKYFNDLIKAIEGSLKTLEIETYIFETDAVGCRLIDAMKGAAQRGVRVRLVVDGVGSYFWIHEIKNLLKSSKVELKVYNPFPIPYKWSLKLPKMQSVMENFYKLNHRLHRKVCIIDQEIAYVGSFNITDRSTRDTAVRVVGREVSDLVFAFESIWNKRILGIHKKHNCFPQVRLNLNLRLRRLLNRDIAKRMREAQARLWITNAYFIPPLFILKALFFSASRDVDVRLLTPRQSDHALLKWMTESFYRPLLKSGVRVFEYEKKFLHAKTIIIDTWTAVGSTNMNHRSLLHDLEVDVVLDSESSLQQLLHQFEVDLTNAKEITLEEFGQGTWFVQFVSRLLKLFKHWV